MRLALGIIGVMAGAAAGCSSHLDCSLNGACQANECSCFAPWKGDECQFLDFDGPATIAYGNAHKNTPNTTAWGGNFVLANGSYHLFVAEIINGCPLGDWQRNSRVTHAVSDTPEGPYTFADVALEPWAHNPQVFELPSQYAPAKYGLFHIGDADGSNTVNCTSFSSPLDDATTLPRSSADAGWRGGGSTLHTAESVNGPWTPFTSPKPPSCNNPAPAFHPNGTFFLVCGSHTLLRSASGLAGPFTTVTTHLVNPNLPQLNFEDAVLFFDEEENFHILFHVYNATTPCGPCLGTIVSGHSFSRDGIEWTTHRDQPFDNTYVSQSGETVTISTRERPKLYFHPGTRTPSHLISAICTATTCPPTPGVNCKYEHPTRTLVAPLRSPSSHE